MISMRGAARAVAARKPSPAPRERDLIERGPLVKEPLERQPLAHHLLIRAHELSRGGASVGVSSRRLRCQTYVTQYFGRLSR